MGRRASWFLAAAVITLLPAAAPETFADTLRLNPTDDAYVDSAAPNTNFGASLNLYAGDRTPAAGGTCWSFVQFDLGALPPGVEILNAELWLQQHEKYGSPTVQVTVDCHHVVAPGWSEAAITWNAPPAWATQPTASVTDGFNVTGWHYWNVTPDVVADAAAGTRTGWLVRCTPLVPWVWLNFWSREQVPMPDERPVLEITYSGAVAATPATWSGVKALFR